MNRIGFGRAIAMQSHDQVLLVGQRPQHLNIFRGKTSGAKASRHGFRRRGHVAGWSVSGIDLNEFFKNVACGWWSGERVLCCRAPMLTLDRNRARAPVNAKKAFFIVRGL